MRLKFSDIKPYREKLLQTQVGLCALCKEPVGDDAVLDHNHKTGNIRGVLHRGCNSMLGKIENNMPRSRIDRTRLITFARNLVQYMESQLPEVHPKHKPKGKK